MMSPIVQKRKLRHPSAQDDTAGKGQSQEVKPKAVSMEAECHSACSSA